MSNLILFPLKLLGWTAAGVALGIGWKLGSYLVEAAKSSGDRPVARTGRSAEVPQEDQPRPLWKRQFPKFSED